MDVDGKKHLLPLRFPPAPLSGVSERQEKKTSFDLARAFTIDRENAINCSSPDVCVCAVD